MPAQAGMTTFLECASGSPGCLLARSRRLSGSAPTMRPRRRDMRQQAAALHREIPCQSGDASPFRGVLSVGKMDARLRGHPFFQRSAHPEKEMRPKDLRVRQEPRGLPMPAVGAQHAAPNPWAPALTGRLVPGVECGSSLPPRSHSQCSASLSRVLIILPSRASRKYCNSLLPRGPIPSQARTGTKTSSAYRPARVQERD